MHIFHLSLAEFLPLLWFVTICIELALYAILDGANLGVGVLTLLPQPENRRTLIIHSLSPMWNANETWLLVAAGTLFGAFPAAFGIFLNAMYIPGMVVVVGLIVRAVSFEFYDYSDDKSFWSKIFGTGSLLAVLGQGMLFGGILSGIPIKDNVFAGNIFTWATPLTILITIGFFFAYLVVGYAYLLNMTDYEIKKGTFSSISLAAAATLVSLLGATFLLPTTNYVFFTKWTEAPTSYVLFSIAGLIGICSILLGYYITTKRHYHNLYYLCLAIFALGYIGMLVAVFPYVLPPSLTIYDAASPTSTLTFMLYGIGPLLPIILAYNFYLARVFRGESKKGEGY
jgi:cytochrome d ubiquinol oxidase subunit II